jgi:predicted nucleotidyltransferase component of viral defense system
VVHRQVTVASFEPEELFGTKLRALLQRRKGRDLFDLNEGLKQLSLDTTKVVAAFNHYLAHEGTPISRANAEERMLDKLTRSLTDDIKPMLAADVVYGHDEALEAFERVWFGLIAGLHGEAWHKAKEVIDEFRSTSIPSLLRRAGS